ncbi:hypothetical protein EI94DRAFT_1708553 [Lactarius quietus]|nr:hypothetical protein EI94DRAFT_1708553 [Lactarius quietus]
MHPPSHEGTSIFWTIPPQHTIIATYSPVSNAHTFSPGIPILPMPRSHTAAPSHLPLIDLISRMSCTNGLKPVLPFYSFCRPAFSTNARSMPSITRTSSAFDGKCGGISGLTFQTPPRKSTQPPRHESELLLDETPGEAQAGTDGSVDDEDEDIGIEVVADDLPKPCFALSDPASRLDAASKIHGHSVAGQIPPSCKFHSVASQTVRQILQSTYESTKMMGIRSAFAELSLAPSQKILYTAAPSTLSLHLAWQGPTPPTQVHILRTAGP